MTVLLRAKRSQGRASRRRPRGEGVLSARARVDDTKTTPPPAAVRPQVPLGGPYTQGNSDVLVVPPAPQDRALYACSCGFVFSQDVSTSVACPHCGGTQAW